MFNRERAFLACDAESRARGVLVKMINVVDLSHTDFASQSSAFMKVLGESSKLSEEMYPQLLLRAALLNPPSFFYVLYSTFRFLMSAKQLARTGICPFKATVPPGALPASACPFASSRFDVDKLPSFLGGGCSCIARGGCIACTPNNATSPLAGSSSAPLAVAAGGVVDVPLLAKQPGEQLVFEYTVESGGLEVSAWAKPEAGPAVQLLAPRKARSEEGAVRGSLRVPVSGEVTLRFSNAHSRFNRKSVRVSAMLVEPAEGEAAAEAVEA